MMYAQCEIEELIPLVRKATAGHGFQLHSRHVNMTLNGN